MIWLIIGIILFVLGICITCRFECGEAITVSLLGLALLMPMISGMLIYPNLVGNREVIITLQSEMETVKNAHYSGIKSGELIGGSLDNLQQSKILSEYVINYAKKKAMFNQSLVAAKIRRKMMIYKLFADGAFISKEIESIDKL